MKKKLARQIQDCFNRGGKLIIFGNGGSMAEASHFAAEFIGLGYPAIALSDPSMITALANDFGYENVFANWISAIFDENDMVIGISSSGNSTNVNLALQVANSLNISYVVDFPRKGKTTSEVQNNQLKLIHEIYEEFKR